MMSIEDMGGNPCFILRYVLRECSSSRASAELGAAEIVTSQTTGRTAIRHGTACKSDIPEWAGEGVGVVGIVYLAWEVGSVMPGPYRGG